MICHFAHQFPRMAGEFLDRAHTLKRSFREETITDVLMGAMVAFKPLGIEVIFSDEPKTGADMEWTFERADGSSRFHLLIQAKKLYGTGKVWSRRSYPEIFHTVGKAKRLQSDALVSTAKKLPATFPLYIFYTHQSVCGLALKAKHAVEGVSFADGIFIDTLVKKKVAKTIKATQASRLGVIQPKMFPIARLLCGAAAPRRTGRFAPGVIFFVDDRIALDLGTIPTPEEVRARLVEILGTGAAVPEVETFRPKTAVPRTDERWLGHFEESGGGPPRVRVIFRSRGPEGEASVE